MGGTYDEFMHLNPRKLEVIYEGYRYRMKHVADEMYMNARYAFYAHSVALANFSMSTFGKTHKKPLKFEDVVKEPEAFGEQEKVISLEERRRYTDAFFANLKLSQVNFELSRRGKE